ncbi:MULTISPECIES: hypothetical protein [Actinomycetes]
MTQHTPQHPSQLGGSAAVELLRGSGPMVRHLPRVLGWTVAVAAAGVVLLLDWFWLLAPLAALILGLAMRIGARLLLGETKRSVAVAPGGGALLVEGREIPVDQIIGGDSHESPLTMQDDPAGLLGVFGQRPDDDDPAAERTADVTLRHTLTTTMGPVDLDLAGPGPDGMEAHQLRAYADILAQADASRDNPAVVAHQDEDPEDYGTAADLTHPRQEEWRLAQLRRDVHTLLRRGSTGGPLDRQWRRGSVSLSPMMSPEAAEAYIENVRLLDSADQTSEADDSGAQHRVAAQHGAEVRRIGEQIDDAAQPMRRLERRVRGAAVISGVLAAAALGVAYLAAHLEAEQLLQPLLVVFLAMLLVLCVALPVLGAVHDRRIRAMRAVSIRELAADTPGGHATAVRHTNWWQRVVAAPGDPQKLDARQEREDRAAAYDPMLRPLEVVRDSPATSPSLVSAWRTGPRLLRKCLSGVAVIVGVLGLFWAGEREDWLLAGVCLGGAAVAGLTLWVFIGREETLQERDVRKLAGTLEQMRTDPAYGAHLVR